MVEVLSIGMIFTKTGKKMNKELNKSPIAISLNFDSLHEAYGFPNNYRDPSFHEGFDRIAKISAKHNISLSIYVVGKDLLDADRASAVKEWASQGHEIGNHSWSHYFNLGSLSSSKLNDEVKRSHDIIQKVTGVEPKGFISPCWSLSPKLIETLLNLNYLYDTSAFPSFLLYPMISKIAFNHWKNPVKGFRALHRKDWLGPLKFPNHPFYLDSKMKVHKVGGKGRLLSLPLPAANRLSPAIWHTIGFIFGWDYVKKAVKKLGSSKDGYYYLIHPADFLGEKDLNKEFLISLERMQVSLDEKIKALDQIFFLLKQTGRPIKTLKEVASSIIN